MMIDYYKRKVMSNVLLSLCSIMCAKGKIVLPLGPKRPLFIITFLIICIVYLVYSILTNNNGPSDNKD